MKLAITILAILLLALACTKRGQGRNTESTQTSQSETVPAAVRTAPMNIVCTTGMIGEIARAVGGTQVSVTVIIPPGADPHAYTATPQDSAALAAAELVLSNGLGLEAGLAGELDQAKQAGRLVEVAREIDNDRLLATDAYGGQSDPHIWLDVELWRRVCDTVRNALLELDHSQDAYFASNYRDYYMELIQLDSRLLDLGSSLSDEQRVLVTNRHGFAYFARANRFELLALSQEDIAGLADDTKLEGLAGYLVERHVPAVFLDGNVPAERIAALQQLCNSRGQELANVGQLDGENLPAQGDGYIMSMQQNMTTIVTALGADLTLIEQAWKAEAAQ